MMLSKRLDAFADAATDASVQRLELLERARELLDGQADLLMAAGALEPTDASENHHTRHAPHRRALSSAARRLIRAHERLEEASQD
jgi:hypothetical protein